MISSGRRGEVWLADLSPIRGHEQKGMRPVLLLSDDRYNKSGSELWIILPITSKQKNIITQVHISPPEGGLQKPSAIICDGIRSISRERVVKCYGLISTSILKEVENKLKFLLGFS